MCTSKGLCGEVGAGIALGTGNYMVLRGSVTQLGCVNSFGGVGSGVLTLRGIFVGRRYAQQAGTRIAACIDRKN